MSEDTKNEPSRFKEQVSRLQEIYRRAKELLDSNPNKFVIDVDSNDYYKGMVNLSSMASTKSGEEYRLTLQLLRQHDSTKDAVESVMILNKERQIIYLLDVESGPGVEEEYLDKIKNLKDEPNNEVGNSIRDFVENNYPEFNGLRTTFSVKGQSEIEDGEALKIINSVDKLSVPEDLSHLPTWQEFRNRGGKLKAGYDALS